MAPRFHLGAVVATRAALALLARAGVEPQSLLERHQRGDRGDLCDDDRKRNNDALENDGRIFSLYLVGTLDESVWIITEAADEFGIRRVTTILTRECF